MFPVFLYSSLQPIGIFGRIDSLKVVRHYCTFAGATTVMVLVARQPQCVHSVVVAPNHDKESVYYDQQFNLAIRTLLFVWIRLVSFEQRVRERDNLILIHV